MLMPVMLASMSMSYIVSFSQYFITLLIGGGSVKTFAIVMDSVSARWRPQYRKYLQHDLPGNYFDRVCDI